MRQYKIMGGIVLGLFIFGIAVLCTHPNIYVIPGQKPDNMLGEVAIWAAGIVIILLVLGLLALRLYKFIQHKILKKPDDDVDNGMIIEMRRDRRRRDMGE